MISITPPYPGPAFVTDDPAAAAAIILQHSRWICREAIVAVAPSHRQINAALGLLDPIETAAIATHISNCRAAQNAVQASVEAIMSDTELDDAGKLAALAGL